MGRNNADFHGVEFSHTREPGEGPTINAHLNGEQVGYLSLKHTGHVEHVEVQDEHQGKGIGTGMWRHAEMLHRTGKIPHPPKHSDERTYEGEFFARSVGGHLPKNKAEWLKDYPKDHFVRSHPND